MDLLHDVEGDGDDAASVLTHSHASDRETKKLNAESKKKSIFLAAQNIKNEKKKKSCSNS